jgi:outer membrane protein TolC
MAEWEKRQAEWQLAQVREGVALEANRFRGELERASALLTARAETVRSAARVYELTLLSFRQGVGTNLQVSDARTALRQARANEAQAVHDYYIALARLLRSSGSTQEDAARIANEMGFQE